jgi:hypothetical protein
LSTLPHEIAAGDQFSFHDQWDGRDHSGNVTPGEYRIIGQPLGTTGPHSAPAQLFVQDQ